MNPNADMVDKKPHAPEPQLDARLANQVAPKASNLPQPDMVDPDDSKSQTFGDALGDLHDSFGRAMRTARHNAIKSVSRHIVNNSSNILGASHVATEMLMFKSSLKGKDIVPDVKPFQNPIKWVQKATVRVFKDSFTGSVVDINQMKTAIKEKPFTGFFKYIFDTKAATQREIEAQGVAHSEIKLGNPWQVRSTLAGLIVWSLSAVIPDKKDKPEEVERMAVLHDTNLIGYIGERLRQAVWFPDWGSHKRQMIGLAYAIIGVCSSFGAWRNYIKPDAKGLALLKNAPHLAEELKIPKGPTYEFNLSYLATAMLSLFSSIPLLFAVDDQKGFAGFGSLMAGRLLFLPSSIRKKFGGPNGKGEDGAMYYLGATTSFQAENFAQALIGGAEKLKDGTIVDHEEIKKRAHEEAQRLKAERRHRAKRRLEHSDKPQHLISEVASVERAMPERAEAADKEVVAAM